MIINILATCALSQLTVSRALPRNSELPTNSFQGKFSFTQMFITASGKRPWKQFHSIENKTVYGANAVSGVAFYFICFYGFYNDRFSLWFIFNGNIQTKNVTVKFQNHRQKSQNKRAVKEPKKYRKAIYFAKKKLYK